MKFYKYLSYLTMITILLLIFFFSSQDAPTSVEISKQATRLIQTITQQITPHSTTLISLTNSQVRDLAHISLFFLFGLSCMTSLYLQKRSLLWSSILTCILGLTGAFLDECIQLTSPGRAFELIDIAKDMLGIVLSILVVTSCILLLQCIRKYYLR